MAADALVALGPDPDLWPGSVLRGAAAAQGNLEAVPVKLGKMRISSTLGGAKAVDIDSPSASAFRDALTEMLSGITEPSGTAVGSNLHVESIVSEEDLSDTIGVDLSLVAASPIPASLGLESRSSTKTATTRVAVSFVQSYFQVSIDPHDDPADYFGPNVTARDLDDALGGDGPAVYVRSVTYGRRVVAIFETDETTNSDDFKATISGLYGGVKGEATFKKGNTTTMNVSRFAAIILGDSKVITDKDELFAYLEEPPDVTTAWPIGYALQYPGSEKPFAVGFTTEVVTKTCEQCGGSDPYPDHQTFETALSLSEKPVSDIDTNVTLPRGKGLLPPDQYRWFEFRGQDDFGIVDPEAKLATDTSFAGGEVCLFASCDGSSAPVCKLGKLTKEGTLQGCCGSDGHAWLTGGPNGLCPEAIISDNATMYIRVHLDETAMQCVSFTLTAHY